MDDFKSRCIKLPQFIKTDENKINLERFIKLEKLIKNIKTFAGRKNDCIVDFLLCFIEYFSFIDIHEIEFMKLLCNKLNQPIQCLILYFKPASANKLLNILLSVYNNNKNSSESMKDLMEIKKGQFSTFEHFFEYFIKKSQDMTNEQSLLFSVVFSNLLDENLNQKLEEFERNNSLNIQNILCVFVRKHKAQINALFCAAFPLQGKRIYCLTCLKSGHTAKICFLNIKNYKMQNKMKRRIENK